MKSLRHILQLARRDTLTLPEVTGDRCVHAHIETAGCRACVDACSTKAWLLDDAELALDAGKCHGCQLCVGACPTGEIQASRTVYTIRHESKRAVLFACLQSGIAKDDSNIPCLHALGVADLAGLYGDGIRSIVACRGDCEGCDLKPGRVLDQHIESLNGILQSRDAETMTLIDVDTDTWKLKRRSARVMGDDDNMTRRQFFRRATKLASDAVEHRLSPETHDDGYYPYLHLPPRKNGSKAVFAPVFDVDSCNACNACVRLCPQRALKHVMLESSASPAYKIDVDACCGCGICVDACDRNAISIEAWSVPKADVIPLALAQCVACGAPFQSTVSSPQPSPVCAICRQNQHNKLLYQVIGN